MQSAARTYLGIAHWVRPWGFSFEQILCPVMVWQGDVYELVPKQWGGEEMARRIPHARMHLIAGGGISFPYNHYKDIFSELIQEIDKPQ